MHKSIKREQKTIKLRIVRELIYLSVGKTQMRVKKKKKPVRLSTILDESRRCGVEPNSEGSSVPIGFPLQGRERRGLIECCKSIDYYSLR